MRLLSPVIVLSLLIAVVPALRGAENTAAAPAKAETAMKAVAPVKAATPALDVDGMQFQTIQPAEPSSDASDLPFTIDLPNGWTTHIWKTFVVLSPPGQDPPAVPGAQNPWVVVLRKNPNKFPGAEAAIANLKANAEGSTTWKLIGAEVRDFGGVQGILVESESGAGDARSLTYTARVPLGEGGLDVIASAPAKDFPAFRPLYERILLSLQPAAKE